MSDTNEIKGFNVRFPAAVYDAVRVAAAIEKVSMNAFIVATMYGAASMVTDEFKELDLEKLAERIVKAQDDPQSDE